MSNLILIYFSVVVIVFQIQHNVHAHGSDNCRTPLGTVGKCVSLKFCPEVLELYTKLLRSEATEYAKALKKICGNRTTPDKYAVVCCMRPDFTTAVTDMEYELIPIWLPSSSTSTESSPVETSSTTESVKTRLEADSEKLCKDINNEQGNCRPLEKCTELLQSLQTNPENETLKTYLRASHEICNNSNTEICCPKASQKSKDNPPNTASIETMQPPTEEEGCGRDQHTYITRIVGGQESHEGAWPWIALLGYNPYAANPFRCGGTLVTARHVITAAHCNLPDLTFVRLGEFDLSIEDNINVVDINIAKALSHQNYNRHKMTFDLAILYLEKNVQFTNYIYPICLPMSNQLRTKSYVSYSPFAAGWGRTNETSPASTILQEVQLLVQENDVCYKAFSNVLKSRGRSILQENFDDSVICAGNPEGGKDTCKGDSGGPLMVPELYKGFSRYYLIGVVSYGIGCARRDLPAIYTSTQYFLDWIIEKIQET